MWDNHQMLRWLANALFALVALIVLFNIGAWAVNSPVFPLKELSVRGVHGVNGKLTHVTREQIESAVHGKVMGNFFTVDLDAMRKTFEKLPWVRVASVRRHWPQRLEVQLEEHVALARWGNLALVNAYGEVFEVAMDVADEKLPLFTGPAESSANIARQYVAFSKLLLPLQQKIAQVSLSPRHAWRIRLEGGTVLELGREQMNARLERYVAVYDRSLAPLQRRLDYVDLRYSNGFAVRLPGAETTQQKPRKAELKKAA